MISNKVGDQLIMKGMMMMVMMITMMKIMIALKTTLCRGSQFKEKIMTLKKGSLPFKTDVLPQSSLKIVSR